MVKKRCFSCCSAESAPGRCATPLRFGGRAWVDADNAKAAGKAQGKGEALAEAVRATPSSGNEIAAAGATDLRALADKLFPPSA